MAKVFVGSIPTDTPEDVVQGEFAKFGAITNYFFKRDASGPQRSWAFVTYMSRDDAADAIEATGGGRLIFPGSQAPCEVSWALSAQATMTPPVFESPQAAPTDYGMTNNFADNSMAMATLTTPAFTAPAIQSGPTKLFVGSIPAGTTKELLTMEFAKFGPVAEVFIKHDVTEPGRMWGFVTYASPEGASAAVATLNESCVFPGATRPLAVSFARTSSAPSAPAMESSGLPPTLGCAAGSEMVPNDASMGPTKVFVGSIPGGTTKELLKAEFEKFGPVVDIFLKADATEDARMWGFVTFFDASAAAASVAALHERLVLPGGSRACAVSFARNSQAQHSMAAANLSNSYSCGQAGGTKLFLGTLPVGTTEALLRAEFERFGPVTEIFLKHDAADPNRMWGFLTFADTQSAAMAVSSLHEKLMLPGSSRPVAVSFAKATGGSRGGGGGYGCQGGFCGYGGKGGGCEKGASAAT
eukprot:TRINITY_DN29606_c0_g3_i2.p1 TRINITY_DN29606_c0_g3~~TRINITY_DN29606_c0_g3_i2.p1  ORF type:complete len:470 (-),score=76.30 TRINITY_DN29606_c0_g3_i2:591-2000(-)